MINTSYEEQAENYLLSAPRNIVLNYYERPIMVNHLKNLKNSSVLDIGCASGYYSKYCFDHGAKVTCIDVSNKMVKHTLNLCNNKIEGKVHDINLPMPFIKSSSIDTIICSLVLHYIENWNEILGEFKRMLKPSGFCIITVNHPLNDYINFNQKNYFNKRLITANWNVLGYPIQAKYYVRTFTDCIQPIIGSNLVLEKIIEPQPVPKLKEIDIEVYNDLTKNPLFLFLLLRNKE